tara:strand:- start:218 stop:622 length:405 start_codon:yes stop_codon:yes gene_type:complete
MKVVLDTNVLVSATLWDKSEAQKLFFELINADAEIYISIAILSEYKKVLKRDFGYSEDEIVLILEKIIAAFQIVQPSTTVSIIVDDPDDNKIIECALAAGANYIVSYDPHLLKLKEYKNIFIVLPKIVRRKMRL